MKKPWAFLTVSGALATILLAGCGNSQTSGSTSAPRAGAEGAVSAVSAKDEEPIYVTSTLDIQAEAINAEAQKLIEARNFAEIEKRAAQYRSSHKMFLDGFWKLGHFYLGLAQVPATATDAEWAKRVEVIRSWHAKNPASVTAQVALARVYLEGASHARGEDSADKVKDKQWLTMSYRLDLASKALTDSIAIKSKCPAWYAVAQRVAFLKQRPLAEFDAITNEAIRAFPLYYDFHFKKINYLMPRWYGKQGDWQKYASQVADGLGGSEGDIFYARALWYVETLVDSEKSVEVADFDWPRAKRGFEALTRKPDSLAAAGAFAQAAWLARDRETLKSVFDTKIGNHLDPAVWINEQEFKEARKWALQK